MLADEATKTRRRRAAASAAAWPAVPVMGGVIGYRSRRVSLVVLGSQQQGGRPAASDTAQAPRAGECREGTRMLGPAVRGFAAARCCGRGRRDTGERVTSGAAPRISSRRPVALPLVNHAPNCPDAFAHARWGAASPPFSAPQSLVGASALWAALAWKKPQRILRGSPPPLGLFSSNKTVLGSVAD